MPLRILQITPHFAQGDGTGNTAWSRAVGLAAAGHHVDVVAIHTAGTPGTSRIRVHAVGDWLDVDSLLAGSAPLSATLSAADLLILDFTSAHAICDLAGRTAAPLILCYHGLTPPDLVDSPAYRAAYDQAVEQLGALRRPDLLVTESCFIRREYERLSGTTAARCEVVPAFGCTQPWAGEPPPATPGRRLQLLSVGRLMPHKNIETAIEALAVLRDRGVPARLRHIGGGVDDVARAYRGRLEALAARLDVGADVEFSGRVSQRELDRALATCDGLVHPSLHEGFSLPAVEGLVHGRPVFAAAIGALPETLGDAGLFFDPFDPAALATAVAEYFGRPAAERKAWEARAARRGGEFSQQRFQRAWVRLVERVAHRPAADPATFAAALRHVTPTIAWVSSAPGQPPTVKAGFPAAVATAGLTFGLRCDALDLHGDLLGSKVAGELSWQTTGDNCVTHWSPSVARPEHARELVLRLVIALPDGTTLLSAPARLAMHPGAHRVSAVDRRQERLLAAADVELGWRGLAEPPRSQPVRRLLVRGANLVLALVYRVYLRPAAQLQRRFNRATAAWLSDIERRMSRPSTAGDDSAELPRTPDSGASR